MATSPTSQRHDLFLDITRGAAAQLVVIGHAILFAFPALIGQKDYFYVQSWAVVVFLALSGFLIARSVKSKLSRGKFALSSYVKDRFARIFTPFLPMIPLIVIVDRGSCNSRRTP